MSHAKVGAAFLLVAVLSFILLSLIPLSLISPASADDPVSLGYGDGSPEDGLWIDHGRGHAAVFTPPTHNWTLTKVAICAMLNEGSESSLFYLEVWDGDLNLLYRTSDLRESYFGESLKWAEIDVPDLQVSGDFLICVFEHSGLYMGVDKSNISSGRSLLVSRNPNRIAAWDLQVPWNGTDWTIAAVGYSDTPGPEVTADASSGDGGLYVRARAADPDGNLAFATLYVIENESLEVIWGEKMPIEGSSSEVEFQWPEKVYEVSNGTVRVRAFAVRLNGYPENLSTYLAYSAPCIMRLAPEGPEIEAMAYFGQDGDLHALHDLRGTVYYRSQELLDLQSPGASYGEYSRNVTARRGMTTLIFYRMLLGGLMVPQEAMVLERSPLQHYGLRFEEVAAAPGDRLFLVEVEDLAGNVANAPAN